MTKDTNKQSGFSLLEILVVVAVLTVVLAVVFRAMNTVQKRNFTEQQSVDIEQNSREFLDQLARDLHNAGYPNAHMYSSTSPNYSSNTLARAGLIAASATDIIFEGDMDGSGKVTTVRYSLQNSGGSCPCTLRRAAMYRDNGTDSTSFAPAMTFTAEVENVVNSTGGTGAWTISGTMPGGTSNNTYYSNYKQTPLFQFLDASGNILTSAPSDLSGGLNTAWANSNVKTVLVTLNALAANSDLDTKARPAATMRATIKLPNL
jgi:prepilin-type N-terminal cleavage/methylation domain-containing protein